MAWAALRLGVKLFYRRIGILLVGNVLWVLASLPLVTLPAATGALFYLAHRVVRDERDLEDAAQVRDFWEGFRRFGLHSTGLWLLDAGALIVLLSALRFYITSPEALLNWLAGPIFIFLLVWLGMQVYLFPLLIVSPDERIWAIIRRAFFLALGYPMQNFMLIVWLIVISAVALVLAGPVLLLLFSFLALVQTVALRILRVERGEIPAAKVGRE